MTFMNDRSQVNTVAWYVFCVSPHADMLRLPLNCTICELYSISHSQYFNKKSVLSSVIAMYLGILQPMFPKTSLMGTGVNI